MTFSTGDRCADDANQRYSTRAVLRCASGATQLQSHSYQSCVHTFEFSTPSSCPSFPSDDTPGAGWYFVFAVIILCLVYFGGGALFKWRIRGTSGMESVPHIEFWRSFFGYVSDGCALVFCCRKPIPAVKGADGVAYEASLMHDDQPDAPGMERI